MLTLSISVLIAIVVLTDTSTLLVNGEIDGDDQLCFSLIVSGVPTRKTLGVVNAVNKTLKLIEEDTTILPGYHLCYSRVLDVRVSWIIFCSLL